VVLVVVFFQVYRQFQQLSCILSFKCYPIPSVYPILKLPQIDVATEKVNLLFISECLNYLPFKCFFYGIFQVISVTGGRFPRASAKSPRRLRSCGVSSVSLFPQESPPSTSITYKYIFFPLKKERFLYLFKI
jgi:hypothetical protein